MLTNLDFLQKGKPFPPDSERERLIRYKQNKMLFEDEHAEVYKEQFKRIERVIGNFEQIVSYSTIIAKNYGEKGIEIAKKAYYNVYNKSLDTFGIIEYLKNNVSKYSVDVDKFDENTGLPKRVTDKDYIEIIPEMLAKSKVSNNRFTDEFIKLLKEMIV